MSRSLSEKILNEAVEGQKKKTARHTLSTAFTAAKLAARHGLDPLKAFAAGEAHDMAKRVPADLAKAYLSTVRHSMVEPPDEFEYACEGLLHGPLAALLLAVEFGIEDQELLSAVRYHSTGHPELCPLGRILMIADYVEPLRPWTEEIRRVRVIAEEDLDKGWGEVLKIRHVHFEEAGAEHHPRALAALARFEQRKNKK